MNSGRLRPAHHQSTDPSHRVATQRKTVPTNGQPPPELIEIIREIVDKRFPSAMGHLRSACSENPPIFLKARVSLFAKLVRDCIPQNLMEMAAHHRMVAISSSGTHHTHNYSVGLHRQHTTFWRSKFGLISNYISSHKLLVSTHLIKEWYRKWYSLYTRYLQQRQDAQTFT